MREEKKAREKEKVRHRGERTLGLGASFSRDTLKSRGTSLAEGILYVPGPEECSRPARERVR